jgi:serine/threonine protein kinase
MTYCIKHSDVNNDKIIIRDEQEIKYKNITYKKRFILYKYDLNICKEFMIITNFIKLDNYNYKYNKLTFTISDESIINIYKFIQDKLNIKNENNIDLKEDSEPETPKSVKKILQKDILSEEDSRFYISEIILAIESVHKHDYIHRDLKPDNILLSEHKPSLVRLGDFGLAEFRDIDELNNYIIFTIEFLTLKRVIKIEMIN